MASQQVTPRSARNESKMSAPSQRSGDHEMSAGSLPVGDEAHASGALTARHTSATVARRKEYKTPEDLAAAKAEFQRQQKRKEHTVKHKKMLAIRERDEEKVRERAVHSQQIREEKFREMMDNIRSNDSVRVEAAHLIQQFEMEQEKKRQNVWGEWDREVSQRIELQLKKYMERKDDDQVSTYREELYASDDPSKRCLTEQKAEESFMRAAKLIIQGNPALGGKENLKEQLRQREIIEKAVSHRATTRPVLPVDQWGQQELFAGPYGYFAQRCERMDRGEPFHSTRRMGADRHIPDETDGVQAAGKKKEKSRSRVNYNHMGMLVGDHCKMGEAYRHKAPHGAGSAAPMQDHYFFDKGEAVVDNEFPVGKKCYPHLMAI